MAQPKLLAAVPGHLQCSLHGLLNILVAPPWCCAGFQCSLAVDVSQLWQFESCLPDSKGDEQRGELAVSRACSGRTSCKRHHFGRNALTWRTDIFAIAIQSRFESVDSSKLWVPSGIYKTDMLSSNKFHSGAMKSREPTSAWTLAAPARLVALWYFQCAEEVKVK